LEDYLGSAYVRALLPQGWQTKNKGRSAELYITYQGVNISTDISGSILSFSANDNASGVSDDITLTLHDRSGKWLNSWFPVDGDRVKVSIIANNWLKPEDKHELVLGEYLLDEPEYSLGPSVVSLKGASVPRDSNFTDTKRDKAWKGVDLKTMSSEMASRAGLTLVYDTSLNPKIERQDQNKQSDMDYLSRQCKRYGIAFKVYSNKIVIYDFKDYEAKPPVLNIKNAGLMLHTGAKLKRNQAYTVCTVSSSDKANEAISYTFKDPRKGALKEKLLEVNESCASLAEAELVAKGRLREANAAEYSVNLTVVGHTSLVAGVTVQLTDFGIFSGKYFIDKVSYSLKPFTCKLVAHRVLGW